MPLLSPLGDRVILQPDPETPAMTKGGLHIPDVAKEAPVKATVLAVGKRKLEDGTTLPLDVRKGDRVLFAKYSGHEVVLEEETFLILRESEVLAIILEE